MKKLNHKVLYLCWKLHGCIKTLDNYGILAMKSQSGNYWDCRSRLESRKNCYGQTLLHEQQLYFHIPVSQTELLM